MNAVNLKSLALNTIKTGHLVRVLSVDGGDHFRRKMADQGILPGTVIEVISGSKNGPFVVRINDTRIIIGAGMTQKISVSYI